MATGKKTGGPDYRELKGGSFALSNAVNPRCRQQHPGRGVND